MQRYFERAQVAVVDAHQRHGHLQGTLQFVDVVHFHQHIHAQLHGQAGQVDQLPVVQCRHDQQDAVGTQYARLVHLIGVDREVLAQHGQRACLARLLQVVVGALEEVDVGHHRQAGRAS
ncbi:hypothetical protein D9M69_669830 [compost metagenome]